MNSLDTTVLSGELEKMGRFIWTSRRVILSQDTFTYMSNHKPVRIRRFAIFFFHLKKKRKKKMSYVQIDTLQTYTDGFASRWD